MSTEPTSGIPAPPRASFLRAGRVLAPLLAYHVLILAGGALIVVGWLDGNSIEIVAGFGILGAGLVTVAAVLAWTARMARSAVRPVAPAVLPAGAAPAPTGTTLCPRCAWSGPGRRVTCPRCGATVVPMPVATPSIRPGSTTSADRPGT